MISFTFNDCTIFNPYISECGRFKVSPTIYGFEPADTGGGCKALVKSLPNGDSLWLTDDSGMRIPEPDDKDIIIGYFAASGEQLAYHELLGESECGDIPNWRFVATWGDGYHKQGTSIVGLAYFTEDNGYDIADTVAIGTLKEGELWNSNESGQHSVKRQRRTEAEFPDYDDELPVFSPFLKDCSWDRDNRPSFIWEGEQDPDLANCKVVLWCDYKAQDRRAVQADGSKRFTVMVNYLAGDTISTLSTPVAAETVEELRELCNVWYLDNVGYRPDSEAPEMSIGQLVMEVGQMAYLHGQKPEVEHNEKPMSITDEGHRKCIVLCINSNGAPEFHTCLLEVTDEQYKDGEHYDLAKQDALANGYEEPMIAFDANDEAAKQLGSVLAWL